MAERFFLISSFGVLHLFERDYSADLFEISGHKPRKEIEEGNGKEKEEEEEEEIYFEQKIPKITQVRPIESIPLGQSYLKSVDSSTKIFSLIHRTKKIFERNKQYNFQCKKEEEIEQILKFMRP